MDCSVCVLEGMVRVVYFIVIMPVLLLLLPRMGSVFSRQRCRGKIVFKASKEVLQGIYRWDIFNAHKATLLQREQP